MHEGRIYRTISAKFRTILAIVGQSAQACRGIARLFVLALNRKWIRLTMHGSVPKRISVTVVTERKKQISEYQTLGMI